MNKNKTRVRQPEATRRKLIEATYSLMLKRGFNATTVDEICAEAGVTKGSFFHHFKNKDDIGQAAVRAWGEFGLAEYARALEKSGEPLEQIHRMFDMMEEFTRQFDPCVCMVGMMSQEMAGEHPGFRAACGDQLGAWTELMRSRLEAAKQRLQPRVDFDPAEVAWFLNSLWQGSMLVGKAEQSQEMIRTNLKLARSYIDSLFENPQRAVSQHEQQNK